ncbi:hypothetical protein F4Z99_08230 [Candidatus Poribacteria bacterium]|nr:hypothetical protein [Candidatus Poribacteria bacterium]MYB00414.1 hypothetical protein [Candidatus Poribacteria bacterium]
MKRDKWIHRYVNSIGGQQMKPKLNILILFTGILLSLPFAGCGIFVSEGEYEAPQLPKSELATIKIDTEGGWLHRYNLIVLRIGGKLALREKIGIHEGGAIDEILVAPGKHDMSMATIHNSFDGDARSTVQTTSRFSADVKAGGTYLLRDEGELVDADTDKVVSKSKLFSGSLFDME